MTPKEIRKVISENPGKPLYARAKVDTNLNIDIALFQPVSKSRLLRGSKYVVGAKVGLHKDFRPDLDPERYKYLSNTIVVFDLQDQKGTLS